MRSSLRVENLKAAQLRLDAVGTRAQRPEPALRAPGTLRDLVASEKRRFTSTIGWRRLTPKWVKEKRRLGLDPRILRATGKLEGALTGGSAAGLTFRAWGGSLFWGIPRGRSDLYYAQSLAKNRPGRRGRKMVVIDKQAKTNIAIRVERYVQDGDLR